MNIRLDTNIVIFKRTLQSKLYSLFPYSDIHIYEDAPINKMVIDMVYYWKGEKINLREHIVLMALEHYEVNEVIRTTILEIQRKVTEYTLSLSEVEK